MAALAICWSITWNIDESKKDEYPDEGSPLFSNDLFKYMVYQLERGQSGNLHFQGYVSMKRNYRLAGMKKLMPGAHLEPARDHDACIHYSQKPVKECKCKVCTKERENPTRVSGPWEFGERAQGKRNDLAEAFKRVETEPLGKVILSLPPENRGNVSRYLRSLQFVGNQARIYNKTASLTWKEHSVTMEEQERMLQDPVKYFRPMETNGGVWYDNYEDQQHLVIPSFTLPQMWRQKGLVQLPTKGGFLISKVTDIYLLDPTRASSIRDDGA